jgi:hypothetical protein
MTVITVHRPTRAICLSHASTCSARGLDGISYLHTLLIDHSPIFVFWGRTSSLNDAGCNSACSDVISTVLVCGSQRGRAAEVNEVGSLAGNESREASSTTASRHSHRSALSRARRSCQSSRTPAQSAPPIASLRHRFAEDAEFCVEFAILSYVLPHATGIAQEFLQIDLHTVHSRDFGYFHYHNRHQ